MRKLIFAFLFLLSFFIFLPHKALASDYFTRDYKILYTVKEDGKTNVSITITLTNKTSDYYASSDTLSVGFNDIENLSDKDPDGEIQPLITKTDQGNNIQSTFIKKAVGIGKAISYTISFDTKDIAHKSGKIWEINIPGLSDPNSIDSFTAEVKVPDSFGQPNYVKPMPKDGKLIFSKNDLQTSAISISYGMEQIYSFNLVYHLQNKNLYPIKTEIALPPATNYQSVEIDSITPRPKDVTLDKDGNWLAQFELAPSAKVDVQVQGKAKVTNHPSPVDLSLQQRADYTKEEKYWESNNPQIKSLARKLRTPQAIYDYVVKNLHYDFNRVTTNEPRLGANGALKNPSSAVCLEFTDLFIALSRAAGIPAREINGFANTENSKQRPLSLIQDVLHAWPEYYDDQRKAWIMVDPTWGNTTGGTDYFSVFDFDHLTFVRKGYSSDYPIPAGGYKYSGDEKKRDVNVAFANVFSQEIPQIKVRSEFPAKALSALPIEGTIEVQNESKTLFPKTSGVLTSNTLFPTRQEIEIDEVPPFGKREITIGFDKTPILSDRSYDFTFNLQGTIIHKSVRVTPIIFSRLAILGGVIIVILTSVVLIIAIKTRRLHLFR
jgi:transglutaminase-like putative cysteine protease